VHPLPSPPPTKDARSSSNAKVLISPIQALSFTDSIIINKADYVIDGLSTEELGNLLLEGEYDEIERMARDSSWGFTFSSDLAASTE
jgi:hypothetical protein